MDNLNFIKAEMLVHIPLCAHADPKKVLLVGAEEILLEELRRHTVIEDLRVVSCEDAAKELEDLGEERFDVAIVSDSRFGADRGFWSALSRRLEERGMLSAPLGHLVRAPEAAAEEMKLLGSFHRIVMPYRYEALEERTGSVVSEYLVLASRFYHPTADLNLQRADLTDGFRYYNSDIAVAAFQMPTFVVRDYSGTIKR